MAVHLRKKLLNDGRYSLYLDIYGTGKRKFDFLQLYLTGDKEQDAATWKVAKKVRSENQLALDSLKYDFAPLKQNGDFYPFAEHFIATKELGNQIIFNKFLLHFKKYAGERLLFKAITREFAQGFKDHLLSQPKLKPVTASLYLIKLRTILNHAIKQNIIPKNPTAGINIKSPERLPKFLTLDELKLLVNTPCGNDQVRNAFLFSCSNGLRLSDVMRLQWKDIADGYIRLSQQKTGQMVTVPLNNASRRILESQHQNGNEVVFLLPHYRTINRTLKRWIKKAGIDKEVSFHSGRHTFATLLISAGQDIYVTSGLLGHKKLATTLIYARLTDRRKEAAIQSLPEIL